MPVKSAKQYGFMAARMKGKSSNGIGPSPEVAEEFIEKTPANKRKVFAKVLANKKKKK